MNKPEGNTLGEEEVDALFAKLLDEDDDIAYDAGCGIHRVGRPVLSRVLALTQDVNPRARELACYVLGQLYAVPGQDWSHGNYVKDGVSTLVRLLEHDIDQSVRAGAAAALGFQKK